MWNNEWNHYDNLIISWWWYKYLSEYRFLFVFEGGKAGNLELISFFIGRGGDIDPINKKGETPLVRKKYYWNKRLLPCRWSVQTGSSKHGYIFMWIFSRGQKNLCAVYLVPMLVKWIPGETKNVHEVCQISSFWCHCKALNPSFSTPPKLLQFMKNCLIISRTLHALYLLPKPQP